MKWYLISTDRCHMTATKTSNLKDYLPPPYLNQAIYVYFFKHGVAAIQRSVIQSLPGVHATSFFWFRHSHSRNVVKAEMFILNLDK